MTIPSRPDRPISRRAALRTLGAAGAALTAAPLLGQRPAGVLHAQPATARVAFVRTEDRVDGIRRALALIDPPSPSGRRLLLKPNLNSADPSPGSTHPETLRTLATWLLERGAAGLTIGDRSGMGDTDEVMQQTGTVGLANELGLGLVNFDDLRAGDWVPAAQPPGSHWSRGFMLPRLLGEHDGVVQTCNLKTHRFGGHFTLSLKNAVGLAAKSVPDQGYNYMTELHGSPYQREMIAEINTAYRPDLIVLDGFDAFLDGGPERGNVAPTRVILAGTDRVAIDAVGVALLRFWGTTPAVSSGPIFGQAQLRRTAELGIGVASPDQIELVTPDEDSSAYAARVRAVLDAA